MGLINKIFGEKKEPEARLVTLVEKIDEHDSVFGRIQNDLALYIESVGENEDGLRKMAYAYARRTSAAGLYLQGIWNKEEYDYSSSMFKKFQMVTGHTTEFQMQANQQALELYESYDRRLTHELTSAIIISAETGHQWPIETYIEDHVLLKIMEETVSKMKREIH